MTDEWALANDYVSEISFTDGPHIMLYNNLTLEMN